MGLGRCRVRRPLLIPDQIAQSAGARRIVGTGAARCRRARHGGSRPFCLTSPRIAWPSADYALFTAVSLGAVMVVRLGRGQFYPPALAWTHGTIAVVGAVFLAYVVLAGAVDPLLDDGALFVAMAASGVAVLVVTGRGGRWPNALGPILPGILLPPRPPRVPQVGGRIQRVDKTIQAPHNHPRRPSRGDGTPAEKHDKSTLRIDP